MITYLEVTDENLEDLRELGLDCNEGDELECEVAFDVNRADPDVGIMSDDVQVTSVTCNGFDVERFFDEDDLHEQGDGRPRGDDGRYGGSGRRMEARRNEGAVMPLCQNKGA
jgi:hypothetical protein